MFLYGCVATKNIVIAEYSEIDGNYHVVIENFLTRINSSQKFTSLLYKKYYIFSYSKDDMVYLSIASSETTLSNLVYFVKEIKKKWVESYGFNGKGFGRNEKDYEFGGEICILISSFKLAFSITTIHVIILVVEAIALFLFSFLPHIILPDFLSYIIPILEFIIGSLILLLATLITSLNSFSSKFSSSSSSAYITPH